MPEGLHKPESSGSLILREDARHRAETPESPHLWRSMSGLPGPLGIIFENSWPSGEVPDDWKKANVVPIFKKGKEEDSVNFRPVSLTSVPGKIMEQVLKESILKHSEERKVISNSQHGFTKGRMVLSHCKTLLASVGAACHSEKGDQPSSVLLSCGIPYEVAQNALRLSVGRDTTKEDVDAIVEDLKQAVAQLEQNRVTERQGIRRGN